MLYKSCPIDVKKSLHDAEITSDCEMYILVVDSELENKEKEAPAPEAIEGA